MACPICAKPTLAEFRPFCSKRCADVDLAKWLGGGYAIPSENPDDVDELVQALEKAAQDGDETTSDDEADDDDTPRLS